MCVLHNNVSDNFSTAFYLIKFYENCENTFCAWVGESVVLHMLMDQNSHHA